MHAKGLVRQLIRYGLTTALSYVALFALTYLLVEYAALAPQRSYALALSIVYLGVFVSYGYYVFDTGLSRTIMVRFAVFLAVFWVINNAFFYILYSLLHIPYLITIAGNLVVLGGIRFLIQRHLVFRGATGREDAALSFDVELWDESAWMNRYLPATRGDGGFRDSMIELLQALRVYGHRATFFVTARVVEEYPDVVETLAAEGHEVGVHGVEHVRLDTIVDRDGFRVALGILCEKIRNLTGKNPRGFRAPHFSLHNETRWLLPILAGLGFRYDSSVFPIRTPEYGVSGSPTEPYRISFDDVSKINHASPLLEIPPSVAAFGPIRIPAGGGVYFRMLPLPLYTELFLWAHAPRVLYFHPHELYRKTPRIHGPFWRTLFKYWGTRRAMRKFRRLCEQFRFDSIEDMLSGSL